MAKNLEKRVEELEKIVNKLIGKTVIKAKKVGDTFELLGITWKVLDITEKGYMCLAEKLEERMKFDSSCNDWKASDLRNYLNVEFYKKLAEEIGEANIIPFKRDLLSLDGQTEYGTCEDKVSLLTFDEYRKYRSLIPNTNDYWWWLITPDSTKCNRDTTWETVVASSGVIYYDFYVNYDGVRPFCIFSSAIFESEEE